MLTVHAIETADGWNGYLDELCRARAARCALGPIPYAELTLYLRRDPLILKPIDAQAFQILALYSSPAAKANLIKLARAVAIAGDAFAAFFCVEAWISLAILPSDVPVEDVVSSLLRPSQSPGRRAALVLTAEHRLLDEVDTRRALIEEQDERNTRRRRCGAFEKCDMLEIGGESEDLITPCSVTDVDLLESARAWIQNAIDRGAMSTPILMSPDEVIADRN